MKMGSAVSSRSKGESSNEEAPRNGWILDCGSGHASLFTFGGIASCPKQLNRQSIKLPDGTPCRLDRMLATANDRTKEDVAALLDAIDEALVSQDVDVASSFLFVGATGGVRAGLNKGLVTQATLEEFEADLVARFCKRFNTVDFKCITGAEEGKWELAAAQAIWGNSTRKMFGISDVFVGVVAGGGTTVQIGAAGGDAPVSYPFSTMWDAMDETKGAPAEAWLDDGIWSAWESSLKEDIMRVFPAHSARLSGYFVGTACNNQAVTAAGFDSTAITAREAVPMLRTAMGEFRKREGPNWDREKDKTHRARYNWFRVMSLQMCRLAHVLEEMFEPNTRLYFTKGGLTEASASLECEWPLGIYMERTAN